LDFFSVTQGSNPVIVSSPWCSSIFLLIALWMVICSTSGRPGPGLTALDLPTICSDDGVEGLDEFEWVGCDGTDTEKLSPGLVLLLPRLAFEATELLGLITDEGSLAPDTPR